MRIESIKAKLLKEALLGFALVIVVGGLTYFLDDYHNEHGRELQEMQNKVSGITVTTNTLQGKYTKVQKNADLYAQYLQQNEGDGLAISFPLVQKKFQDFKNKYFIGNNTKITLSKVEDLKDQKYVRPTVQAMSSEVKVTFEALTDEDVFAFIRSIGDEMPGIVKFKRFNIKRDNKVSDDAVRVITASGQYKLVSGEIAFTVYGIKPVETNPPAASAPNAAP